jgi:hypothetical protein
VKDSSRGLGPAACRSRSMPEGTAQVAVCACFTMCLLSLGLIFTSRLLFIATFHCLAFCLIESSIFHRRLVSFYSRAVAKILVLQQASDLIASFIQKVAAR